MQVRRLAVEGAYAFSPQVFRDERGLVVSQFLQDALTEAMGRPLFPVPHASTSSSRKGVVRGVHFTATPPGTAKYVYCPSGRSLDIVVDIRVGSPTYGLWDTEILDADDFRAVYLPVGVGHVAVALEDHTLMNYLWSGGYVAGNERALAALDPALGLPIPDDIEPLQSPRDTVAPTLAQAEADGLLPRYDECAKLEESLTALPVAP